MKGFIKLLTMVVMIYSVLFGIIWSLKWLLGADHALIVLLTSLVLGFLAFVLID